ncbi:hypothetical protein UPYG_G00195600 [Umbra pygmaea]|uniref:Uncharacterized protein n=1 Tax=Umbra pygmaea TaxID=75934 RepID=A0ABD0WLW9_UMBPY
MLQQNNNNNYPCLEVASSTREVLEKCHKSYLPFTSRLELGDMPLVKGLRAWAVCSNRRKAAPSARAPGTCLRPADICPVGQWGGLGYDLGLPVGPIYSSNSRQAGLGALVTVATLKATEGGGQTQTRCLFLKSESGRCRYSTNSSPRPCSQRSSPQSSSRLVGGWLRDKVGGVRDSSLVRKMGERDTGVASFQVKPRTARRWRTPCKPGGSIQGEALKKREDAGRHTLEGSLGSTDKGEFPTAIPDILRGKQDRGNSSSLRCSHSQTRSCTECLGSCTAQQGSAFVCEKDRRRGSVNTVRETEEVEDGTGLSRLKQCISGLPPDNTGPENSSGYVRERGQPDTPFVQEVVYPKSSYKKECLQDKPGDIALTTGAEDASRCNLQNVEGVNGMVGAVSGFVDQFNSAERKSERLGDARRTVGEWPDSWTHGQSPGRHCCSESGCHKGSSAYPPSPAGGSISTAADNECCGQIRPEIKLDSRFCKEVVLGEKCSPNEKEPAAVDEEGLPVSVHGVQEEGKEAGEEEGIWSTNIKELSGEQGELQPGAVSEDDGSRLVRGAMQGDFTSLGTENRPVQETRPCESEQTCRTGERCISDLAATSEPAVVGGGRGEVETGLPNSPSRGPATSVTRSPPNPHPPGAMATGFPAPEGVQTKNGALAPVSPEEQDRNRARGVSEVAADTWVLDEGPEEDDGFGLFMQAEELPADDGFTASSLVPSGKTESVGWTDSSFHQSEGAWTAFQQDREGAEQDTRGHWWPSDAVEETRSWLSDTSNVNSVFFEAFSSPNTPCCGNEAVPTLSQLLKSVLDHESSAKDHGLLDDFHDLNKMIGLKYKRGNAVSRERLLHSLKLGQCSAENMSGNQATIHSPTLGLPLSSLHAQTCGKRRLSYDLNKNSMK